MPHAVLLHALHFLLYNQSLYHNILFSYLRSLPPISLLYSQHNLQHLYYYCYYCYNYCYYRYNYCYYRYCGYYLTTASIVLAALVPIFQL